MSTAGLLDADRRWGAAMSAWKADQRDGLEVCPAHSGSTLAQGAVVLYANRTYRSVPEP